MSHDAYRAIENTNPAAVDIDEGRIQPISPLYGWYAVAFLHAAYALSFIDRFIIGLLVPSIKHSLDLSDTRIGLLMGPAFAICYVAAGLLLGVLVDRRSRRLIVAAAILTWSLATMSCGLAHGFSELFACRVVVGIGEAAIAPAALSLISDYFAPGRRALAISIFGFGVSVGASAAFMLGGILIKVFQSPGIAEITGFGPAEAWRLVFLAVGAPGILLAGLALTVPEPRRRHATGNTPIGVVFAYLRGRWRLIATHFGGFALFSVISVALAAWVPVYLMRRYGMSVTAVGAVFGLLTLAAGLLGSVAGGLTAGWLHRLGRKDSTLVTVLIGVAATFIPAVLAPWMPTATTALCLFAIVFLAISFASGPSIAAVQESTPSQFRGQLSALYYLSVNVVGLTLGPLVVPLIGDKLAGGGNIGMGLSITSAIVVSVGGVLIAFALRFFRDEATITS